MALRLPIGESDFALLRREGSHYVDKTRLAVDVIRGSAKAVLLPRPRRFGKTLNLTMLRYWFERPEAAWFGPGGNDIASLFAGLEVASAGDDVAAHFQRHPVVFLTFKDVKHARWTDCRTAVVALVAEEVARLAPVWTRAPLTEPERSTLERVGARTPDDADLSALVRILARALHLATGEPVVLLIDEYDTPIHAGWTSGYYEEVASLFRKLLSGGLKDGPDVYRGVLTGILRIAKESMFSGLNNLRVCSLLSPELSTSFGFTEAEVDALCGLAGPGADRDGIREWYNGYRFGDTVVYNPWSVLNYLAAPAAGLQPYWVNSASDDLLRDILLRSGGSLHADLTALLNGEVLTRAVNDDVQLRDLTHNADEVWNFLLFCGYLKATDVTYAADATYAALSIPNREVRRSYTGLFRRWLSLATGSTEEVDALCRSLLTGDVRGFEGRFQRLVVNSLSSFDTGGKTPEAVYQAFLVGLLVHLDATHLVDTNRESGFGRYDVCVRPRLERGTPPAGAVIELKSVDPDRETAQTALAAAMRQLRKRAYAAALHEAGATPVWLWAVAFDGKRVHARVARG